MKNLGDRELIKAGEVEMLKNSAIEATKESYEKQIEELKQKYEPIEAERDGLKVKLENQTISNAFSRSKFIEDRISVP